MPTASYLVASAVGKVNDPTASQRTGALEFNWAIFIIDGKDITHGPHVEITAQYPGKVCQVGGEGTLALRCSHQDYTQVHSVEGCVSSIVVQIRCLNQSGYIHYEIHLSNTDSLYLLHFWAEFILTNMLADIFFFR